MLASSYRRILILVNGRCHLSPVVRNDLFPSSLLLPHARPASHGRAFLYAALYALISCWPYIIILSSGKRRRLAAGPISIRLLPPNLSAFMAGFFSQKSPFVHLSFILLM